MERNKATDPTSNVVIGGLGFTGDYRWPSCPGCACRPALSLAAQSVACLAFSHLCHRASSLGSHQRRRCYSSGLTGSPYCGEAYAGPRLPQELRAATLVPADRCGPRWSGVRGR